MVGTGQLLACSAPVADTEGRRMRDKKVARAFIWHCRVPFPPQLVVAAVESSAPRAIPCLIVTKINAGSAGSAYDWTQGLPWMRTPATTTLSSMRTVATLRRAAAADAAAVAAAAASGIVEFQLFQLVRK